MERKKDYFGIYDWHDLYDNEVRDEVREGLAEGNNLSLNDVPEQWIDDVLTGYLDDEKTNLDLPIEGLGTMFAFGTLGLWDGKHIVYKVIGGTNLNDFLETNYGGEHDEFYADRYNVRVNSSHHDGTNHFVLRIVDNDKLPKLKEKLFLGEIKDEKQLFRYTKSIRPLIAAIYGWKQYGMQKHKQRN